MQPLLSIGMIFRNDVRCLERCMNALLPLRRAIPCELVMADTGSEDGSREVAERYADILFEFPWINDFSAARNAVMERCSGKWYMSIDSDDVLDPNVDELAAFLQSELADNMDGAYMMVHDYLDKRDLSKYTSHHDPRMLNMSTGLRFQDKIHEHWPWHAGMKIGVLNQTCYWHDGYINDDGWTNEEKSERNLKLLQQELLTDPGDLRHVVEALESSIRSTDQIRYAKNIISILHERVDAQAGNRGNDSMEAAAYRTAVNMALDYKLPEALEWAEEAEERYPDSLYIQVDVQFSLLRYYFSRGDWAGALSAGERYLEGYERYTEHAQECSLTAGILLGTTEEKREMALLLMAMADIQLRDWEGCRRRMEQCSFLRMSASNVSLWARVIFMSWEQLDWTEEIRQVGRLLFGSDKLSEDMKDKRRAFTEEAGELFAYRKEEQVGVDSEDFYPEQPALPLLEELGSCDLARLARLCLTDRRETARAAVGEMEAWRIPVQGVLPALFRFDLRLPSSFCREDLSIQEQWAQMLVQEWRKTPELLLQFMDWNRAGELGLEEKLWSFHVSALTVQSINWRRTSTRLLLELSDRFADCAGEILTQLYHPAFLCEERIQLIPQVYGYAWLYLQARRAEREQSTGEYIRLLRRALGLAPNMRNMIEFLLREAERAYHDRQQMLELAAQVKSILSAYEPDDPAVREIKNSPVYQKIAYLLED